MGGLIKATTPPSPKLPQPQAVAQVDTVAAERDRRKEALARQRSGRAGTITTSSRGLLTAAEWLPERKSLLGE